MTIVTKPYIAFLTTPLPMKKLAFLLVLSIALTSCSTIFFGPTTTVLINSTPPGAKVYCNGIDMGVVTPAEITVSNKGETGSQGRQISYKLVKEGYEDLLVVDRPKFRVGSTIFGNLIFPSILIGLPVDISNGSAYKYYDKWEVSLKPGESSISPDPIVASNPSNSALPNKISPVKNKGASSVVTYTKGQTEQLLFQHLSSSVKPWKSDIELVTAVSILIEGTFNLSSKQANEFYLLLALNQRKSLWDLRYKISKKLNIDEIKCEVYPESWKEFPVKSKEEDLVQFFITYGVPEKAKTDEVVQLLKENKTASWNKLDNQILKIIAGDRYVNDGPWIVNEERTRASLKVWCGMYGASFVDNQVGLEQVLGANKEKSIEQVKPSLIPLISKGSQTPSIQTGSWLANADILIDSLENLYTKNGLIDESFPGEKIESILHANSDLNISEVLPKVKTRFEDFKKQNTIASGSWMENITATTDTLTELYMRYGLPNSAITEKVSNVMSSNPDAPFSAIKPEIIEILTSAEHQSGNSWMTNIEATTEELTKIYTEYGVPSTAVNDQIVAVMSNNPEASFEEIKPQIVYLASNGTAGSNNGLTTSLTSSTDSGTTETDLSSATPTLIRDNAREEVKEFYESRFNFTSSTTGGPATVSSGNLENTTIQKENNLKRAGNDIVSKNYKRSSLYTLMINDPSRLFHQAMVDGFGDQPIDDKYNDHNIGPYLIDAAGAQDDQTSTINNFLRQNQVAKKMVAKWFNYEPGKGFDMDLIAERGQYNASELDVSRAEENARGLALLSDAGEQLIQNTFIVVNDYKYTKQQEVVQKTKNTVSWIKAGASFIPGAESLVDAADMVETGLDVASVAAEGYVVKTTSYLYQLEWNDSIAAVFYNDYWTSEGNFSQEKLDKFAASNIFRLKPVGYQTDRSAIMASVFTDKSEDDLVKISTIKATDKGMVQLQRNYDEFMTKTPLISVDPITAKIGMKEGLEGGEKFEVLEQLQDENGKTYYRRVTTIKVDKNKVWDNRYFAAEEKAARGEANYLDATHFKGSGRNLYPGMLIRQIK